jgi:hypothetical protein
VQQVVAANDLTLRVAEEREGVAGLPAQLGRGLGRVGAEGDQTDAARLELGEMLLQAP